MVVRQPIPEPEVVALACEDLDGDAQAELLLMSRRSLLVGKFQAGKFVPQRSAPWDQLSPIAPSPWRQPLGSAAVRAPGHIDVGLTDRAQAVRLDAQLRPLETLAGMPVPTAQGSACAQIAATGTLGNLQPCTRADGPIGMQAPFGFDTAAAAPVITSSGEPVDVWALREPSSGTLALFDSAGRSAQVRPVGAQVAIGDVDFDGWPEVIASRDVLQPHSDALVVRTWGQNAVEERASVPAPDGIAAVALCPADSAESRAMAVATSKELWIVR